MTTQYHVTLTQDEWDSTKDAIAVVTQLRRHRARSHETQPEAGEIVHYYTRQADALDKVLAKLHTCSRY